MPKRNKTSARSTGSANAAASTQAAAAAGGSTPSSGGGAEGKSDSSDDEDALGEEARWAAAGLTFIHGESVPKETHGGIMDCRVSGTLSHAGKVYPTNNDH